MSSVRSKNTKPETAIRRLLHGRGFRFRLHRKDLPGKPDLVLPKYRTVIFVDGCFWHQHLGCRKSVLPKTNADFWQRKLASNVARDKLMVEQLQAQGWKVIRIWECSLNSDPQTVADEVSLKLKSVP